MRTLITTLILALTPTLAEAAHPITPVATDVTAFIGQISTGPMDTPIFVQNMNEFQAQFSGANPNSETPLQLKAYFENGGTKAYVVRTNATGVGSKEARTGVYVFENSNDVNLIVMPDLSNRDERAYADAVTELLTFAKNHNAFAVLDAPVFPSTAEDPIAWTTEWRRLHAQPQEIASFGAMYFPRFTVSGVGGAVAGIYARTDHESGVWGEPLGAVQGGYELNISMSLDSLSRLQPFQINTVMAMPNQDIALWGAATLVDYSSSSDRYVMTKRLMINIEQSIKNGLAWTAFEKNEAPLWNEITVSINNFLMNLYNQGALIGARPEDAFQVACGLGVTMTGDDINNGIVKVSAQLSIMSPAEYEVIELEMPAQTE